MSRSRLGSSMPQGKRKRAMDVVASSVGLLLASPFLIIACVLVWLEDRQNPFYVASRVGRAVRPWKSRLGLHYIAHRSLWLDIRLVAATLLVVLSRRSALAWVADMLTETSADPVLTAVARRDAPLAAAAPPGATEVVQSREPAV